jgi:hypothetical protein
LSTQDLEVAGGVGVGGVGDLRNTISNLADGDAILDLQS